MPIHFIPAFTDNYIYIAETPKGAWIIDPGCADPVFAWCAEHQRCPSAILCTHHHADHTGGVEALVQRFRIPVYGANQRIPQLTHAVRAGLLALDKESLTVLEVPGHTRDHLAYVWKDALFCGDTLFAAGCGRLFEGTAVQMFHSLQQFARLPGDTAVYCAHEYTLSNLRFAAQVDPENPIIAQRQEMATAQRARNAPTLPSSVTLECASNPFLRCHEPALIRSANTFDPDTGDDPVRVFSTLRRWKDHFS